MQDTAKAGSEQASAEMAAALALSPVISPLATLAGLSATPQLPVPAKFGMTHVFCFSLLPF